MVYILRTARAFASATYRYGFFFESGFFCMALCTLSAKLRKLSAAGSRASWAHRMHGDALAAAPPGNTNARNNVSIRIHFNDDTVKLVEYPAGTAGCLHYTRLRLHD